MSNASGHWRLQKSARQLEAAGRAFASGDWETAASRAYYASYHAIVALLETATLVEVPRNHARLHNLLRANLASTGLDRVDIQNFGRLFQERLTADYEPDALSRERAEAALQASRGLVAKVRGVI